MENSLRAGVLESACVYGRRPAFSPAWAVGRRCGLALARPLFSIRRSSQTETGLQASL